MMLGVMIGMCVLLFVVLIVMLWMCVFRSVMKNVSVWVNMGLKARKPVFRLLNTGATLTSTYTEFPDLFASANNIVHSMHH